MQIAYIYAQGLYFINSSTYPNVPFFFSSERTHIHMYNVFTDVQSHWVNLTVLCDILDRNCEHWKYLGSRRVCMYTWVRKCLARDSHSVTNNGPILVWLKSQESLSSTGLYDTHILRPTLCIPRGLSTLFCASISRLLLAVMHAIAPSAKWATSVFLSSCTTIACKFKSVDDGMSRGHIQPVLKSFRRDYRTKCDFDESRDMCNLIICYVCHFHLKYSPFNRIALIINDAFFVRRYWMCWELMQLFPAKNSWICLFTWQLL